MFSVVFRVILFTRWRHHRGCISSQSVTLLRTDLSYPACIASGNFILEFPSINSRSRLFSRWRMRASARGLWSRRQVWLPRMRQRDACWAGEVSLKGSHFATMTDGSQWPNLRHLGESLGGKERLSWKQRFLSRGRVVNARLERVPDAATSITAVR